MFLPILAITVLGICIGLLLGLAGKVFAVEGANPLIKEAEKLLPGSQCGQCGLPGCSAAAEAVVNGEVPITFCPPGGRTLYEGLAKLLDIDMASVGEAPEPVLATINGEMCTGCTRCSKACPTDAIVGATGQLHFVLADACTGCRKCVDTCPEGCVSVIPVEETLDTWHWQKPQAA